jgi:hypothetical protein
VFIHIISQFRFNKGHQLFQGFIAVSVCKSQVNFSVQKPSQEASILLFFQLTTQKETEF